MYTDEYKFNEYIENACHHAYIRFYRGITTEMYYKIEDHLDEKDKWDDLNYMRNRAQDFMIKLKELAQTIEL